jgi:hypothetical protein
MILIESNSAMHGVQDRIFILRVLFGLVLSYLILQAKPSTHPMCAQDHLFHTYGYKVFTDSQIS